jgi:hypothetical protein
MSQKFIYVNKDILVEWTYSHTNISENYYKLTNLSSNKINFISSSNNNSIQNTLFCVDEVIKKYTLVDSNKFNIIQIQTYSTPPVEYDMVRIHIPTTFDFEENKGFMFSIYTYDYYNEKYIYFSDFFYDSSDPILSRLIEYQTPFVYGEREWNRCITLYIPSLDYVSKQRTITSTSNVPIPFSINSNMSTMGISQSSPIIIQMQNITGKETILGTTYYYMGDLYSRSIPMSPEYETLGVVIEESEQGDFFEIYGVYKGSNENMDDFVYSLSIQSKKINIEYTITVYEENIQSGYPVKIKITDNFSQKIEYRPILKYSNTTCAIDVQMDVIDLYDYSSINRRSSIGLTKNIFKYGKTLSQISCDNMYKPYIYNHKKGNNFIYENKNTLTSYEITKIPYPTLIEKYKLLVNSSNSTNKNNEYVTNGLLNILLTPFDNIIKFQLYKQENDNTPEPYDLNTIISYGEMLLVFKSDTSSIEKNLFYQSGDNNLEYGVIIFKINESDIPALKQMLKSGFNNFYIVVKGHKNRTMLYSGKFDVIEDVKYIKYPGSSWSPYIPSSVIPDSTDTSDIYDADTGSVNLQELYNRIASLEDLLEIEKLAKDNDVRELQNLLDKVSINTRDNRAQQTPAEIFKNNFDMKNQEMANYILFTTTNDETIFINSIFTGLDIILQNHGLSLYSNLYYYNAGLNIIILQSIKRSFMDTYISNPTTLSPYIKSIIKIDIGLGLTDLLFEYQQPVADFSYTPTSPMDGDTIVFKNTSQNTNNTTIYTWSTDSVLNYAPNATSSVDFTTTVSTTEFITTNVKLTVVNGIYSDSITKTIIISPEKVNN